MTDQTTVITTIDDVEADFLQMVRDSRSYLGKPGRFISPHYTSYTAAPRMRELGYVECPTISWSADELPSTVYDITDAGRKALHAYHEQRIREEADDAPTAPPISETPEWAAPYDADDLAGVVQADGDVNAVAPMFVVQWSALISTQYSDPHEAWDWLVTADHLDNVTVNGLPASMWLAVYDQLKPWLKEAR